MNEELKACRNCGGKCDPTGWMRGDGRQGPECEGCGITTPDVESWNRLMGGQAASQGGEAVEVVAYRASLPDEPDLGHWFSEAAENEPQYCQYEPLMTVAQHQRILAAATHPADQVAEGVVVSRELLQDLRDLAFDQVEHHRAAMGAYKQTRQSAMDSVLAQADALLRS